MDLKQIGSVDWNIQKSTLYFPILFYSNLTIYRKKFIDPICLFLKYYIRIIRIILSKKKFIY